MRTFAKASVGFVGIGAAGFLAAQFAGPSVSAAGIIYAAAPLLSWLLGLWLFALAGLLLYLISSGITGKKIIPFLTGINVEAEAKDFAVNALKMSFSGIMTVLLLISLIAFVRVNVYTGYECEKAGDSAPCAAKRDTKRIIFLPGVALPGSELFSRTLPGAETGNMAYFVANTPPVGGAVAASLAFLTLLFIAISRISLMISKKRAAAR